MKKPGPKPSGKPTKAEAQIKTGATRLDADIVAWYAAYRGYASASAYVHSRTVPRARDAWERAGRPEI